MYKLGYDLSDPSFLAFTLVSRQNHRWLRRGQLENGYPSDVKMMVIYYLGEGSFLQCHVEINVIFGISPNKQQKLPSENTAFLLKTIIP